MGKNFDIQSGTSSNIREQLQQRMAKVNPRRKLTAEETKRLAKLEGIADKLKGTSKNCSNFGAAV